MFCPNCGTEQPDDARFCQKCGRALTTQSPAPLNLDKPGGFAGAPPPGQAPSHTQAPVPPPAAKKGMGVGQMLGLGCGGLVFLGVILAAIGQGGRTTATPTRS